MSVTSSKNQYRQKNATRKSVTEEVTKIRASLTMYYKILLAVGVLGAMLFLPVLGVFFIILAPVILAPVFLLGSIGTVVAAYKAMKVNWQLAPAKQFKTSELFAMLGPGPYVGIVVLVLIMLVPIGIIFDQTFGALILK